MGKRSHFYSDSEETDDTSSSIENVKKKRKFSILKYSAGNIMKKKCKLHAKSQPDDSDCRSKSVCHSRSKLPVKHKLRGILKKDRRDRSSDEEEDSAPPVFKPQDRCLVGRVPLPAGAKPGRGGGVAILVRKNVSALQPQESSSSAKKSHSRRLARKKSY